MDLLYDTLFNGLAIGSVLVLAALAVVGLVARKRQA